MAKKRTPTAVVSFYRFVDIAGPDRVCAGLQQLCDRLALLGTVLIASEGCNGTLAGNRQSVQAVFDWLQDELKLEQKIDGRWTEATEPPFRRMRVRVKDEIVTLGRPDIQPQKHTGRHVAPAEWNRLIADPNTLLIDARNHYEIEVGTFASGGGPADRQLSPVSKVRQ